VLWKEKATSKAISKAIFKAELFKEIILEAVGVTEIFAKFADMIVPRRDSDKWCENFAKKDLSLVILVIDNKPSYD
jgi:hypothetical protein